jgi:hypothetical protein
MAKATAQARRAAGGDAGAQAAGAPAEIAAQRLCLPMFFDHAASR